MAISSVALSPIPAANTVHWPLARRARALTPRKSIVSAPMLEMGTGRSAQRWLAWARESAMAGISSSVTVMVAPVGAEPLPSMGRAYVALVMGSPRWVLLATTIGEQRSNSRFGG